jgi:hypothetical protein
MIFLQAFLIWKFPNNLLSLEPSEYTNENMEEVCYDQLKTTYQNDYTGIPQGQATVFNRFKIFFHLFHFSILLFLSVYK